MKKNQSVTFFGAIKNFFYRGLDFRGVATRKEFWSVYLFYVLVYVGSLIGGVVIWVMETPSAEFIGSALILFGLGCRLVGFVPCLALFARRFHDVGLGAWIYLGPVLFLRAIRICVFVMMLDDPLLWGLVFWLLNMALVVLELVCLVLLCLPSNKYRK